MCILNLNYSMLYMHMIKKESFNTLQANMKIKIASYSCENNCILKYCAKSSFSPIQ